MNNSSQPPNAEEKLSSMQGPKPEDRENSLGQAPSAAEEQPRPDYEEYAERGAKLLAYLT